MLTCREASIVHDDVQGAKLVRRLADKLCWKGSVQHVAWYADCLSSTTADFLSNLRHTMTKLQASHAPAGSKQTVLTWSDLALSRSLTTTRAPCRANSWAAAAPMPCPLPVMMATCGHMPVATTLKYLLGVCKSLPVL